MKNYIQPGEVIDHTAAAAILSGGLVLIGTKVGAAETDIALNATGSVRVEGVVDVPKLATDVVAQGAALYLDNANKRLTVTASGNTYAGYAFAAAGNGVATVLVKLNG